MSTRTHGSTTLVRLMMIAAFIAMLAVTSAQRAAANQTGADVDAAAVQAGICRLSGGTATIESHRTVGSGLFSMKVSCAGGYFGNWYCHNFDQIEEPSCYRGFVRPAEQDAGQATGGVEVFDDAPPPSPESAEEVATSEPIVEPEVIEESAPTDDAVTPTPDLTDIAIDPDLIDEVVVDEPVVDEPPIMEDAFDPTLMDDPIVDGSVSNDNVVSEFVVYDFNDMSAEDATLVGP